MRTHAVHAGDHIAALIRCDDGMGFIAIMEGILHPEDAVYAAIRAQQIAHPVLLGRQLLRIAHFLHLAAAAARRYRTAETNFFSHCSPPYFRDTARYAQAVSL